VHGHQSVNVGSGRAARAGGVPAGQGASSAQTTLRAGPVRSQPQRSLRAGFSSQDALAAKLGFDRTVIAKAETGERPPTDDVLVGWCQPLATLNFKHFKDFRDYDGLILIAE
jgi:hypothetical protein